MSQSSDPRLQLGPITQVGIVVRDAEAAVAAWTSRFHFDPPLIVDWPTSPEMAQTAMYHGKPANFRMRLAFIQAGPVQIEFIQPLEGNNIYFDFLAEHGEGIHHILFETAEDPRDVAAHIDAPILQSGGSTLRPGALWAYMDTQEMLKVIVELKNR